MLDKKLLSTEELTHEETALVMDAIRDAAASVLGNENPLQTWFEVLDTTDDDPRIATIGKCHQMTKVTVTACVAILEKLGPERGTQFIRSVAPIIAGKIDILGD